MKNNSGMDDSIIEGFEEFLTMGLNSSAEVFSKLLNTEVDIEPLQIISENVGGLASFGSEPGVVVSLNISGAIMGRAAAVIQSDYAKRILGVLMNTDDEAYDENNDIDEVAMGTIKELVGQMAAAFSESASTFFGSGVSIETVDIYELSPGREEIAAIFECPNDANVYSVVSKFDISAQFGGSFNIEINKNTIDFTINRLNMVPGTDAQSMYMNAVAGGIDPMSIGRTGRPVSVMKNSINVQSAQFPSFANQPSIGGISLLHGNMDLLMDVPLNVTIEIGKTRKKMRDIMEFAQGTVIDLEKQAGAPVDIVVNGQLIARGDVVVIDDNFGVRITEIVGNNALIPKES